VCGTVRYLSYQQGITGNVIRSAWQGTVIWTVSGGCRHHSDCCSGNDNAKRHHFGIVGGRAHVFELVIGCGD
jgi:hypothetical protein